MSGFVAEFSATSGSGTTTLSVTITGTVPAGDTLIASIATVNASFPVMYADAVDSRDNNWRFARSSYATGTLTSAIIMYAHIVWPLSSGDVWPLSSGDTVTFTFPDPVTRTAISIAQFNDALTADVNEVGDNGGTSTATLTTNATATTTDANELIFGAFALVSQSRIFTATNGFTGLTKVESSNGTNDRAIAPEYKYVSSTGTYTADGTLNLGSVYVGVVQAFRQVAPSDARTGVAKAWDGGSWVQHDTKVWDGGAWTKHKVKGRVGDKVKGRVGGDWIGPVASAGRTIINETFENLLVGDTATLGNTRFGSFTSPATTLISGISGLHGNAVNYFVDTTTASASGVLYLPSPARSSVYVRFYFRHDVNPSANVGLATIRTAATPFANIQVSTTGKLRVRNGTTLHGKTSCS